MGALATCAGGKHAHPDGREHFERAEPPSERDRVVDRAAAGIQHDSFALELMIARESIEIAWGLGANDADCADPASAIRLASDPAELHRQLAFFEGGAGIRRAAQHGHQAEQCDATGGGAEQHPSSGGRPVSEHDSLTSAGYRVVLAALPRRIYTGDSRRCRSGDTTAESSLSQRRCLARHFGPGPRM